MNWLFDHPVVILLTAYVVLLAMLISGGCAGQNKLEKWEWCAGEGSEWCSNDVHIFQCEYDYFVVCMDE